MKNPLAIMLAAASLTLALATPSPARAEGPQMPTKRVLSLGGARRVIDAAIAEAAKTGATGVIAVVDDGGHLLTLDRLDGTFPAGAEIAVGKARTAALFRKPTSAFEDIIKKGRTAMVALPDFTPLQGGVPLVVDGQVVGGVGVSGASSAQQDEEFAVAAAAALTSADTAATQVTHLPAAEVTSAFARGVPLLEVENYKIHASRRERPGQAEVHEDETDIIYVLDGTATFVTGGTLVDGRTTAPGEIRGASISGGDERPLGRGDVVVVPRGTPHWFKAVGTGGPFLYYVVKVVS